MVVIASGGQMARRLEPESMNAPESVRAYAAADFAMVNAAFIANLLEMAPRSGPVHAIDLGTGPADIPIKLASICPNWIIEAVDSAPRMLEVAQLAVNEHSLRDRVRLRQADAKQLPFADATFDVLFSNSLLHHLPDAGPCWSEWRRVCKPGALIFIRDLSRPATEDAARQIVDLYAHKEPQQLKDDFFNSLLAAYTPAELREQVARAHLNTLRITQVSDRHVDVFGFVE